MTNDLVKIAKEFPKGFYTVTNKREKSLLVRQD